MVNKKALGRGEKVQDFYKSLCKKMLREYMAVRDTITDMDNRIKELEDRLTSTTVRYGVDPVQGGGSSVEDTYINIMAKKALLQQNNDYNKELVEMVEKALDQLGKDEKDIVLTLFASGQRGMAEKLAGQYHYDKSHIYNIANQALVKLSYKMFGGA